MKNENNSTFLKIDLQNGKPIIESIFISADFEHLKSRNDQSEEKKTKPKPSKKSSDTSKFEILSQDVLNSYESYSRLIPFIFTNIKESINVLQPGILYNHIKESSKLIEETQDYQIFSFPLHATDYLQKKIIEFRMLVTGFANVPELFIMGMITKHDVIVSNLVRTVLSINPGMLSSEEKNISLKDLIELGSIEAARDSIINKEVENLMRSSHANQLQWFDKRLKAEISGDKVLWSNFIEVCERRNLITHTNGIISNQYLRVCSENGYDTSKLKVGDRLRITGKYLADAELVIFEMGVRLVHKVWRKVSPKELDKADEVLGNIGYQMIKSGRPKLAIQILRFGLTDFRKHSSEAVRRRMVINYACAQKLAGLKREAEKTLSDEDWSASSDNFKICVHALRDEVDDVCKMMKNVVQANLMNINDLREWPAFKEMAKNTVFISKFEETFEENYVKDLRTAEMRIII